MIEIESEMVADSLPVIGPGLNRAFTREDLPVLTDQQEQKYASLFDRLSFNGTFLRVDGVTRVWLNSQTVRSRDFLFAFEHKPIPTDFPLCSSVDGGKSCGICVAPLDAQWFLEYRWTTEDEPFSPEACFAPSK